MLAFDHYNTPRASGKRTGEHDNKNDTIQAIHEKFTSHLKILNLNNNLLNHFGHPNGFFTKLHRNAACDQFLSQGVVECCDVLHLSSRS